MPKSCLRHGPWLQSSQLAICFFQESPFNFKKYGDRYLAEMSYRFNRRFNLKSLLQRLLVAGIGCKPQPERLLRSAEVCC